MQGARLRSNLMVVTMMMMMAMMIVTMILMMMTARTISPIFIHHKTGELGNSSHCGSAGPRNEIHNIGKDDDDDGDGDDGGGDDDDEP